MQYSLNAKSINDRIILSASVRKSNDFNANNRGINEAMMSITPGKELKTAAAITSIKRKNTFLLELDKAFKGEDYLKIAGKMLIENIDAHKNNLKAIDNSSLYKKGCVNDFYRYITAYAGAITSRSEVLFLSLESSQLIPAITRFRGDLYGVFQLLPYFERPEYIIYVLSSSAWKHISKSIDLGSFSEEVKKTLCSSGMLRSRILTTVSPQFAESILPMCSSHPDILHFFSYLSATISNWSQYIKFQNIPSEVENCIAILDILKEYPNERGKALELMDESAYDKRLIHMMKKKLSADIKRYLAETKDLSICMTAAWLLDRDDVLSFPELDWLKYHNGSQKIVMFESTVLYAMLHKWNRFLEEITGTQELCNVAVYLYENLHTKFRGFSANMFSRKQLLDIYSKDLYPGNDPLPSWINAVTFDQLVVLSEVRNARNKDELLEMYHDICNELRTETASKRFLEFLKASNQANRRTEFDKVSMKEISECLIQHDLDTWGNITFSFKVPHSLVADALPFLRTMPALREARNEEEARFVLRNPGISQDGLDNALQIFCMEDKNVLRIKEFLELDDSFYRQYKDETSQFFIQNTDIVCRYLDRGSSNKKQFRLIIKAAMCNKLNELKYHDGDLDREIGFRVPEAVAESWESDMVMPCESTWKGTCKEDSSFYGIMTMGIRPFSTCMSYRDGVYSECLLSYFDANKKIVYRLDQNGNTIARAVLRLTKATYSDKAQKNGFGFIDVEATENKEIPILFLERMYTGYQGNKKERLMSDMVRFAEAKASAMGIKLVVSDDYKCSIEPLLQDRYSMKHICVYITRSKSGMQYLDSFSGKATHDNGEDCFKRAICFIKNE